MPARVTSIAVTALALLVVAGCTGEPGADPDRDSVDPPALGACRVLTPASVAAPADDSEVVDCAEEHTAETYAVGPLPDRLSQSSYDDPALGAFAFRTCSKAFMRFLGADESLVLRTLLSWAWFRPSEEAWDAGARWYRCDVVGGDEDARDFVALPETAKGLMSTGVGEDRWMQCIDADAVPGSPRIPCSEPHTWRAVTTIKVGAPGDPYPGDRLVEVTSRDYCSESVSAWLGYPLKYTFAYTWFHEAEWKTGNRRSICWARTAT